MFARRLKHLLRPLAFETRQLVRRAGRWVRPPLPWDGRHHPALLEFEPWRGESDGRFFHDFLGVRTDPRFRTQFVPDPPGPVDPGYPVPHQEYLELAFVLEGVLDARNAPGFSMAELGAGYGTWLVTAARAMRLLGGPPAHLVGVEMVPQHLEWMAEHFRNNGIDPEEHTLIHAAVTDRAGPVRFVPEPERELAYGQSLDRRGDGPGVEVPGLSLNDLLREMGQVDLIHCDIQGEERRAIPAALDELNRRVRRLYVATHSRRTHARLREALVRSGWNCNYDFRVGKRERTAFGDVQFLDGMLACVNPARAAAD